MHEKSFFAPFFHLKERNIYRTVDICINMYVICIKGVRNQINNENDIAL